MDFTELKQIAYKEWEKIVNPSKILIFVGLGTCGKSAQAEEVEAVLSALCKKKKVDFEIIQVGCIGLCYLEPLVEIIKPAQTPVYFGNLTVKEVPRIVNYILHNKIPQKLIVDVKKLLKYQTRRILKRCGLISPENIYHYIANDGYSGIDLALKMSPEGIINEIKKSGLRGRGGIGFPTGRKWELCRNANTYELENTNKHELKSIRRNSCCNSHKFVICNAEEGEPGTFKDRLLLESDPHSVIEGMLIAGYAVGAETGYIYINHNYTIAIDRVKKAIEEATKYGLLGRNILGSQFNFQIFVTSAEGGYVSGEETALLELLSGKKSIPRSRPPYPVEKGVFNMPTVVNNVETYANVPQIILYHTEWFRQCGNVNSSGTKLFSVSGEVNRPGVVELPLGIRLRRLIFDICGGLPKNKKLKAVSVGGPTGGCVPKKYIDISVDFDSLSEIDAAMGSGGIIVIDETQSMVELCKYFAKFNMNESCGKCSPCRIGTVHLFNILKKITDGKGTTDDINKLQELAKTIKLTALCGLGQSAPNPVISTLKHFYSEYQKVLCHK
ncbi:MAG: NADH-ubiquinone oxidoreductase-F iron-sulfur binding region domain-containing protein [Elusimicrobiota bacterium]